MIKIIFNIKRFFLGFVLMVFICSGCSPDSSNDKSGDIDIYNGLDPSPNEKTVFIEMQPWYGDSENWYHWGLKGHNPDDEDYLINNERRDISSLYYPLIGAYNSYDSKVIDWQLDITKAMLIDCVMIDYYGNGMSPYNEEFQHYHKVIGKIISRAEKKGYESCIVIRNSSS